MNDGQESRTVLVTGASGGIGQATALAFGARGYRVAVHYHTRGQEAAGVAEAVRVGGGEAGLYQADLTSETDVERLFAQVEEQLGGVEVLVNNAGVAWQGLLTDMTLAQWRWVIDSDLTSVFLCCRRVLPGMIRRKSGCIINISSMWGQQGASCEAAYSAAKAGIIGLTKALAQEEGPSGVRVNCIAPGVIDTPMNGHLSPADIAALKEETPLMKTGTPEDVARAAVFLSESGFVTGQTLGVNGGFVM